MAAANLIARFESKLDAIGAQWDARLDAIGTQWDARLDALKAEHDAKLTAIDTKLRILLWMVPVEVAVIGILFRVLR